jgi:RNA exonuclease 4
LTSISGITPRHIYDAEKYDVNEKNKILNILKGRIVVGHSLNNDFKALKMEDLNLSVRDISKVSWMRQNGNA